MKPVTFPEAVGAVLESAGFAKISRSEWTRQRGDYLDSVDVQTSNSLTEVTVNLKLLEVTIRDLIIDATPEDEYPGVLYPVDVRLPALEGGNGLWWKRSDPGAPAEVAEALHERGLPFLDDLHEPEALMRYLEARGSIKWRDPVSRLYVAVILRRLGWKEAACLALADPPRRVGAGKISNMRRLIGCPEPATA